MVGGEVVLGSTWLLLVGLRGCIMHVRSHMSSCWLASHALSLPMLHDCRSTCVPLTSSASWVLAHPVVCC